MADIKADIRETRARLAVNVEEATQRVPFLSGRADARAVSSAGERLIGNKGAAIVFFAAAVASLVMFSTLRRRRRSSDSASNRLRLHVDNVSAVVFDVDGTLVDSNAAHAETWAAALTEHGIRCRPDQVRPLVGMGADKLLPKVAGVAEDSDRGRSIARRKKALFAERLPHLKPTPGARALVAFLRDLKKEVVVATSANEEEMSALLKQANVADLIPRRTSKDDAEESKPDPDIVRAALARAGTPRSTTLMIGDTPYDTEAARKAGIDTIALRCGGYWSDVQLGRVAGIFDSPADVLSHWRQQRIQKGSR